MAATVIQGGSGYVSVPGVHITGGGGSGAQATATVVNGVVTAITATNACFGYTSPPSIQIDPPLIALRQPPALVLRSHPPEDHQGSAPEAE